MAAVIIELVADAGNGALEAVLTYPGWWDCPRSGIALVGGQSYYFDCQFSVELDDYAGQYRLWPVPGDELADEMQRDPRILVHSAITSRDGGEGAFKIRGRAIAEHDIGVQSRYAAAVAAALGWKPEPGRFHLFAVDIQQVTFIRYDDATGDQHVAIWPPPREFIRRGTTATSLGDREPITDILVSR